MDGCESRRNRSHPDDLLGFSRVDASVGSAAWERPEWGRTYVGHLKWLVEDGLEELQPVLAAEGRKPSDHLKDDAAEAPPVYWPIMALLFDHLGSQVLRSAADGHSLLILKIERFGESKVGDLNVAGLIKEDIFWFETE